MGAWWTFGGDLSDEQYRKLTAWLLDNWDDAILSLFKRRPQSAHYLRVVKDDVGIECEVNSQMFQPLGFRVGPQSWGVQIFVEFTSAVARTRFQLELGLT
jgi:hypothetical protein